LADSATGAAAGAAPMARRAGVRWLAKSIIGTWLVCGASSDGG
jgi:hypothetical protein